MLVVLLADHHLHLVLAIVGHRLLGDDLGELGERGARVEVVVAGQVEVLGVVGAGDVHQHAVLPGNCLGVARKLQEQRPEKAEEQSGLHFFSRK